MTSQLRVTFEGRVQGVGFRWTARSIATGFKVGGYVHNMPNGTVEMIVQGDEREVNAFVKTVEADMARYITRKTESWSEVEDAFSSFQITY